MTKCINDFESHLLTEKQMSFGLVIEWVLSAGWFTQLMERRGNHEV